MVSVYPKHIPLSLPVSINPSIGRVDGAGAADREGFSEGTAASRHPWMEHEVDGGERGEGAGDGGQVLGRRAESRSERGTSSLFFLRVCELSFRS